MCQIKYEHPAYVFFSVLIHSQSLSLSVLKSAQRLCYDRDSFVWIMRQRKGEQQALLLFLLSDKQYFHKVFLILSDQREMTD